MVTNVVVVVVVMAEEEQEAAAEAFLLLHHVILRLYNQIHLSMFHIVSFFPFEKSPWPHSREFFGNIASMRKNHIISLLREWYSSSHPVKRMKTELHNYTNPV